MSVPFADRLGRVRQKMHDHGCDVVLLSVGADLPWLVGYEAMPLERLTMLVVPVDAAATLIVPALEAPRVNWYEGLFDLLAYGEDENPVALVAQRVGAAGQVAISDRTWARFVLALQAELPGAMFVPASEIVQPLRAVKDASEQQALYKAGAAVDRIAQRLQRGEIPLIGTTERQLSQKISDQLLQEGHVRVNFAIVAAGENAASPHHEPTDRVIGYDEVVLCDFGGTMLDPFGVGYCSDITRCVWTGTVPGEVQEIYNTLQEAQAQARQRAVPGITAAGVDLAARQKIVNDGWGEYFIHRTGHGIGVEEHEDPYIVATNPDLLVHGNAFSIEPGIYVPGRFGFRLEDIVITRNEGTLLCNNADRSLVAHAS